MKGLYHYQGMQLHYLSESEDYAVYKVSKAVEMIAPNLTGDII